MLSVIKRVEGEGFNLSWCYSVEGEDIISAGDADPVVNVYLIKGLVVKAYTADVIFFGAWCTGNRFTSSKSYFTICALVSSTIITEPFKRIFNRIDIKLVLCQFGALHMMPFGTYVTSYATCMFVINSDATLRTDTRHEVSLVGEGRGIFSSRGRNSR